MSPEAYSVLSQTYPDLRWPVWSSLSSEAWEMIQRQPPQRVLSERTAYLLSKNPEDWDEWENDVPF